MEYVSRVARRLLLIATFSVMAGACHSFDPEGDSPMQPLSVYREWWNKTEACSGRKGNFDRIRWQVVDGYSFSCKSGQCVGHWESDHEIWIAKEWLNDEMVVRHEMLHDLIDQPGHPNPPFGEGCPLTWESWHGGATSSLALHTPD